MNKWFTLACVKQIDWPELTKNLMHGNFSAPLALLAERNDSAPHDEHTLRLGFAIYAQMRNLPEAEKYLRKLETKLGRMHGDMLTARAQYEALIGNWPTYNEILTLAFEAWPSDPAFCQRAVCARLIHEGLYDGWAKQLEFIMGSAGYQPTHFLRGVHQLAITMMAIGKDVLANDMLVNLLAIADNPLTKAAALMDLTHIATRAGNAAAAIDFEKQFHALRSVTPAVTQAIVAWQGVTAALPERVADYDFAATVIVPTNLSQKIHIHKNIAPPKIDMIASVLEAFYTKAKAPRAWPVIIVYDMPTASELKEQGEEYLRALEKYVGQNVRFRLVITHGNGLRRNFVEQMQAVRTPFTFLLEHDWLMNDNARDMADIYDIIKTRPFIHSMRYNLSPVLPDTYDAMLLPFHKNCTLTNGISNNPCLLRTAKVQRDWLPILQNSGLDTFNRGAAGVEETLYAASAPIYGALGFIMGHQAFGTYLAAPLGAPHQIENLGI